jgi:hypothetical protein
MEEPSPRVSALDALARAPAAGCADRGAPGGQRGARAGGAEPRDGEAGPPPPFPPPFVRSCSERIETP